MKIFYVLGMMLMSLSAHADWVEGIRITKIRLFPESDTAVVMYSGEHVPRSMGSTELKAYVAKGPLQSATIALLDQARMAKRAVWLLFSESGEITGVEVDR